MKTKLFGLALLALTITVPAHAKGTGWVDVHGGFDSFQEGDFDPDTSSGAVIGGTIGYDFDLGHKLVAGLEAGVDTNVGGNYYDASVPGRDGAGQGRDITVAARLGIKIGKNGKLYALAGYSNLAFQSAPTNLTTSENYNGWRAGVGYAHRFGKRFLGKVEFRHADFENGSFSRNQGLVGLGFVF